MRTPPPVDVLHYEIVQEQAAALGRMGRALEKALAALAEFDAAASSTTGTSHSGAPVASGGPHSGFSLGADVLNAPGAAASARRTRRSTLVDAAGQALWMFVVQREACGMRDSRAVMRQYGIPADVQSRMGFFPAG